MATKESTIERRHGAPAPETRIPDDRDLENRDSAEIQRRIDRTRGAMDETLDELGERLAPRNLVDSVIDAFRSPRSKHAASHAGDSMNDFAQNLGRQVRDNPVPSLLVGAGLAWLAFGSRQDHEHDHRDYRDARRYLSGGSDPEAYDDWEDRRAHYDESYHTDEDLLITEAEATPSTSTSHLELPETFGEDEESSSSSGMFGKAKRGSSAAASAVGDKSAAAKRKTTGAASSAAESAKHTASSIGDSTKSAASSVKEGISSAASATASSVKGAVSSVGDAASSAGSSARRGYRGGQRRGSAAYGSASRSARRAGQATSDQLSAAYETGSEKLREAHEEYPLGLGLGFLALGALAGLALPRTRREDEWMGEASDELIDEAWQTGEQVVQRGRDVVEDTVETAKQTAEEQGLTGDSLAQRAANVAEKTATSASQAAKQEGLHPQQLSDDVKTVAKETSQEAKDDVKKAGQDVKSEAAKADPDAAKAAKKSKR